MHLPSFIAITGVGFVSNIAWGVIMPSLWAYIQSVEGNRLQLGVAVSVFSLAQFVFLQIFGLWADKRTMRECLYVSFAIGMAGYLLYSTAHQFAHSPYMIIFARFLAGIEAGNLTITNSFVSACTAPAERMKYMAKMNLINISGLIFSPAFNYALLHSNFKVFGQQMDQFIAAGWFIAILHVVNILMFLFMFKEPKHKEQGSDEEEEALLNPSKKEPPKQIKPIESEPEGADPNDGDALLRPLSNGKKVEAGSQLYYRGEKITKWEFIQRTVRKPYGVCFIANFVQNFLFAVLVTIITPITAQRYGFTSFQNSIVYSAASAIMVVVIFIVAAGSHIIKHIDRVVILVSQLFMAAGLVCIAVLLVRQELTFVELCFVVILILIGVPGQNTSISSIYSKFITLEYGKEKLGEYTGLLLQFGSIGSVLGPLWGGFALNYSPTILASVVAVFLICAIIWTLICFKSLVLPDVPVSPADAAKHKDAVDVAKQAAKAATERITMTDVTMVGIQQFAQYDGKGRGGIDVEEYNVQSGVQE